MPHYIHAVIRAQCLRRWSPQKQSRASRPAPYLRRLCVGLPVNAGHIHTPCLVMLNQEVDNLFRRQILVSVKREGREGAEGESVADVCLSACGAVRQLYGLHVVRKGNVQAVLMAADE